MEAPSWLELDERNGQRKENGLRLPWLSPLVLLPESEPPGPLLKIIEEEEELLPTGGGVENLPTAYPPPGSPHIVNPTWDWEAEGSWDWDVDDSCSVGDLVLCRS